MQHHRETTVATLLAFCGQCPEAHNTFCSTYLHECATAHSALSATHLNKIAGASPGRASTQHGTSYSLSLSQPASMAQLVTCSATWAASHGFETLQVPNFSPERKSRKKYWFLLGIDPRPSGFHRVVLPIVPRGLPGSTACSGTCG